MTQLRTYLILFVIAFWSCQNNPQVDSTPEEIIEIDEEKDFSEKQDAEIQALTSKIIDAIPTVEDVNKIIEEINVDYDRRLPNPIENAPKYQIINSKVINLGVYLSDLGYISSFEQKQEVIFYVNCAKRLSEGIGVSEVVDEETIENLELNIDNQDSLIAIIRRIYKETDLFLKQTNRQSVSAMLIAGGWLESMYLTLQMMNLQQPEETVISCLLLQRETYANLIQLLQLFNDDPNASELTASLVPLGDILQELNDSESKVAPINDLSRQITDLRTKWITP